MYYLIDCGHAPESCCVVWCSPDRSMYDVAEILAALCSCFEEANRGLPGPNTIADVLEEAFGFEPFAGKQLYESIRCILDVEAAAGYSSFHIWDFEGGYCTYLDLHAVCERMAGRVEKWLTPEIRKRYMELFIQSGN